DGECDVAETCDGDSFLCPDDGLRADDDSCAECAFPACSCSAGICLARLTTLSPASDVSLGADSYFPADPVAGCHSHETNEDLFEIGTWESSEELRGVVEFVIPEGAVGYARLSFRVQALAGVGGQPGPGDFDVGAR